MDHIIPGFRSVPRTGVIYVTHEATRNGFAYGHPDWANTRTTSSMRNSKGFV